MYSLRLFFIWPFPCHLQAELFSVARNWHFLKLALETNQYPFSSDMMLLLQWEVNDHGEDASILFGGPDHSTEGADQPGDSLRSGRLVCHPEGAVLHSQSF